MQPDHQLLRWLVVATMMIGALVLLHTHEHQEQLPAYTRLAALPTEMNGWTGREVAIDPRVRNILGQGEFMERVYSRSEDPMVDLFIAYFPSQRSGTTVHSPKNCLPASGWRLIESGQTMLTNGEGRRSPVNRYLIGRGPDRQVVLYWFQAHDRIVASEYWAKFDLVVDAISTNRTDGALVRIVTPIAREESTELAEQRAVGFAQLLMPKLHDYIPR